MARIVNKKRGFTLLELLVTLSIFIIMTTLLLANQHRFSNSLDLENLAYDVALTVRQAQTYGFAVRGNQATAGADNTFNTYYGIHIDLSAANSFTVFADTDRDATYDSGEKIINTYALNNNFTLKAICSEDGTETCYTYAVGTPAKLDVVFKRPDPDAYMSLTHGSTVDQPKQIRIKIKSVDNKCKGVDVYKSGQISVVDVSGSACPS